MPAPRAPRLRMAGRDDADDTAAGLARRATAARLELEALSRRLESYDSQFVRFAPRLEALPTARPEALPVVEQATGVLTAQAGYTVEEALTLLRLASQRAGVPVRDVAAGIVRRASSGRRRARLVSRPGRLLES